jgi:hypothetical protein
VLGELGLRVSAAEAHVTHGEALASLGSPAFIELASGFRRRIEGDAKDREVVLVDEPGPAAASERPLSPLLPSEL